MCEIMQKLGEIESKARADSHAETEYELQAVFGQHALEAQRMQKMGIIYMTSLHSKSRLLNLSPGHLAEERASKTRLLLHVATSRRKLGQRHSLAFCLGKDRHTLDAAEAIDTVKQILRIGGPLIAS